MIITDCYRSYHNLDTYNHLTVNHSETFKDPITGAYKITVAGTWNAFKIKIARQNRKISIYEEGNILGSTINDFLLNFSRGKDAKAIFVIQFYALSETLYFWI
ncbi:hypothetical protein RF11_10477 [Thelohanellus kitauei]|uniref:ISXO2-like transposase domain-containing protein n=1 Tax=Thelohanellus kitauei TaxID=669202 RepID=A0A0C2IX99_THEKT|nr:hypothetical protein RF11_10477 [Thelohanellus kitauei]